jgi:hypothetical protein
MIDTVKERLLVLNIVASSRLPLIRFSVDDVTNVGTL